MTRIGRPTKYRPELCDDVVEFMAQGYSLTAWAGSQRINPDTAHEWRKVHPAFSDAVKKGQAARVRKLEDGLLSAKPGQAVAFIFALKNACPAEWRDVQRVEHSGPDGEPIEVQAWSPERLRAELARAKQLPDWSGSGSGGAGNAAGAAA